MNAIHIHKKLHSKTLHLPELKSVVGKTVEITVQDAGAPVGTPDWDTAMQLARELEDYDFDAFQRRRDYDALHAGDHLP